QSTSLCSTDDDDIIPFNSSEYEKISLASSNTSSIEHLHTSVCNRKRPRSPDIKPNICTISIQFNQPMAKSTQRMSLTVLPTLSPSTFYYSLTNINDYDDDTGMRKKQKRTSSKLDIGYASGDDFEKKSCFLRKKSHSDYSIHTKPTNLILSKRIHSLPSFTCNQVLPEWWRHSITSAYDTCSNPDIDTSIEEKKKSSKKPSLLIYSKKYTKFESKTSATSNSYDASGEYTDADQSENDVDALSSSSPTHYYRNSEALFYNRYTTTTTGYSSDIETTTNPSEIEHEQSSCTGEVSQMNSDKLTLPSTVISNGGESLTTVTTTDKIEASEPCWDGYQSPLFYPLNSQDIDTIESTLKWDDQFFEMDQLYNSSSDDDIQHPTDNSNHFLRTNNCSSLLISRLSNKQQFDSDSDLDDFNYVINETERQLNKTRQSLEKKKRRQQAPSSSQTTDHSQRKLVFDEIHRTCETNIQCIQQILTNLHHSTNSRLNNTQVIELLETYLSDWYAMRRQVNDARPCSRHFLYLSQELMKLRVRFDEQLSPINTTFNPSWFENHSFDELKERIYYEIELDKE
ncbi:unnamed protein product, partial [Adineta ricciae]